MKSINKSVMALGALFLCSSQVAHSAEPQVSFYGLLDVYVATVKADGADKRTLVVDPSGMTTSFIGAKTKVDLGHGLSGLGVVESFLRPDTGEAGRYEGDQFYARDAFIGLEGGFGSVTFGRNTTPYFISVITTNPFGGSFGFAPSIKHSFLGGLQGDSGWGNSVLYGSPKLAEFSASLLYSAGEVTGETGTNKVGISVFYSVGKLHSTLAYQSVDAKADDSTASSSDNQTADLLGVDYDFGSFKLFGQYQKMKSKATSGDVDYKTYQIGASAPVGLKSRILASYAHTSISAATDTTHKTAALGYDVYLTKQLDLYAVLYRDNMSDVGTGNTVALGGRVRF